MSNYSTRDAATRLGIAMSTLSRYIASGKVPTPRTVTGGGMTLHLWTDRDVEKVRKLLPKLKNGRKKVRRKVNPQPKKK